jgi:hypothetical protein
MNREKFILICLMIAIVILVGVIASEQVKIEKLQEQTAIEPKAVEGQYTIIQYPSGAWANAIYITSYKLDGNVLWYKEKGSTEDKPIWFSSVILADGWVEGKALEDYGYWTQPDIDLN